MRWFLALPPVVDLSGFDLFEAACYLHSSWLVVTQQGATEQLIISSRFPALMSSENLHSLSSVNETDEL